MTRPTRLDAVILDYNGVIGLQPTRAHWLRLAHTASWPEADLAGFQRAFWNARDLYDAGQLSDLAYWARVLGAHPGSRLLRELLAADTAMWTETDESVLAVLRRAHATGLRMVLLSNAPAHLSTVLDTHGWRRLMTQALYSARLQVCKPDPAAYHHALRASGVRDPRRVLFVDDRADNCQAAARLGLRTLHYTGSSKALQEALALAA
ncbi:HAD family phosphatase [Streptomyces sp. B3I8]|uniref:HAD family hydrolase n=1 Tax=Streptomyces sp. B3I8 TaxID=3042303 RepID=UPI00278629CB|nr:HAD family phosphatase [Streptomyces sp. B3I8]MDQ0790166.1 putative hydrolase of the HAD superfamily [Streptomyces sp. B3I8]